MGSVGIPKIVSKGSKYLANGGGDRIIMEKKKTLVPNKAKFRKSGGNRWSTKQDLVEKVVENNGEA